jgi:hypothetical protein
LTVASGSSTINAVILNWEFCGFFDLMIQRRIDYRGLLACACLFAVLRSPLMAYSPESPEVVEMVERAMAGLTNLRDPYGEQGRGVMPLVALPFVKADNREHPHVRAAIEVARQFASDADGNRRDGHAPTYAQAVSLIFLAELDSIEYRPEIERLLKTLQASQHRNGGWTYPGMPNGDTSQTQYAMLALLTAHEAGFDPPLECVERSVDWLLRTQDRQGGFGYHPIDPGSFNRQSQSGVTLGLSAAGSASLYIGSELLGLRQGLTAPSPERDLPPALRLIKDEAARPTVAKAVSRYSNRELLRERQQDANRYFDATYRINPEVWNYYYLYTLERYMSFREAVEGGPAEPRWYNEGVEYLKQHQRQDGTWLGTGGAGAAGDTAFAILFLTRATKRSPRPAAGEGLLAGGKQFLGDMRRARLNGAGKVVSAAPAAGMEELLDLLESGASQEIASLDAAEDGLSLDANDATRRAAQVARLQRLVSAEDFAVRRLAVRMLGKSDDFDNIPYLVYALTDPDTRIGVEADLGLKQISRKLNGVGMPRDPNQQQLFAAAAAWTTWYEIVNPSAIALQRPPLRTRDR